MGKESLKEYRYNGARSMVLLHETYLKSFLETWREAKNLSVLLPETEDSDYLSLETLLRHVLRAARGYMTWICEKVDLPDPEIRTTPEPDNIANQADEYLVHLLERWRLPLAEIEEENFHSPTYTSRWGVDYCVDAMLEHAVMHPIRHEFQLRKIIEKQQGSST